MHSRLDGAGSLANAVATAPSGPPAAVLAGPSVPRSVGQAQHSLYLLVRGRCTSGRVNAETWWARAAEKIDEEVAIVMITSLSARLSIFDDPLRLLLCVDGQPYRLQG